MPIDPIAENKSAHRLAFDHYLRTGQRLTIAQWLERTERKFNPYHDELGRFTSAPGVTVSWGARSNTIDQPAGGGVKRDRYPARMRNAHRGAPPASQTVNTPSRPRPTSTFQSQAVRDAVIFDTYAPTYRQLNEIQARFDQFRASIPHPSRVEKEDFKKIQSGYDRNRRWLDSGGKAADREVGEILRVGLAPYNWAVSGINVATGRGELRDYLGLAELIPFGGVASRLVRAGLGRAGTRAASEALDVTTIQSRPVGRSHAQVVKARPPGSEANHIPPDSVNGLKYGEGPAIPMKIPHHKETASWGGWASAKRHRRIQKDLIDKGDFRAAQQMDIDDIRGKFGEEYDEYIEQMLKYSRDKGYIK